MDNAGGNLLNRYFQEVPLKKRALHLLAFLISIDVVLQIMFILTLHNDNLSIVRLFHLDMEKNIPSLYSSLKLLIAAIIAFNCVKIDVKEYAKKLPVRFIWYSVTFVLLFMSFDEYFSYHEDFDLILFKLKILTKDTATLGGYAWPWTIFGGAFVLLYGAPMSYYFFKLFSRYRYLLVLLLVSGFVFVLGAIGFENVGLYLHTFRSDKTMPTIIMFEEFFEMAAVSLAIFVFVRYRGERLNALQNKK